MFAFTADDHWEPGIGDPTVVGWVTVVAYFVAAVLCGWCAWKHGKVDQGWSRSRLFWTLFTVVLVLLGINKQLDLQTWFTLFTKHLALQEGWYEDRQRYQVVFIAGVAVIGLLSLVAMRWLAGRGTRSIRMALIGGVILGCFILIRASSFHHVDQMLGMDFEGIKVNWILELGGIAWIALAALLDARAPGSSLTQRGQNFIWVTAPASVKQANDARPD